MTMAAFQDAASEYAAAGIVPLPIDGKKPLVSHPDRFGRRAALQIAAKPQFANAGLGFWCGHHNGLTVADIDDPKDAALQYVLDTFGASPIIVRTASRKHHVWVSAWWRAAKHPAHQRAGNRHPGGGRPCGRPAFHWPRWRQV
jgi:hypothetical protein